MPLNLGVYNISKILLNVLCYMDFFRHTSHNLWKPGLQINQKLLFFKLLFNLIGFTLRRLITYYSRFNRIIFEGSFLL